MTTNGKIEISCNLLICHCRSSSEDEEENEEPELNLRPQKPLMSPVKTALSREAGSALTPSRVPLGDVDNKDNSLVI